MAFNSERESIDELIKHFWQNGYMTLSRRYGTYLPSPDPVGSYMVDAVGRYNKKYALGLVLSPDELLRDNLISKLEFLATRHTRQTNKNVTLFIGVHQEDLYRAKNLLNTIDEEARKNIRLVVLNPFSSEESEKPRTRKYSKIA